MKSKILSLLNQCLAINPLEKVLVLTDRKMQAIGKAIYEACRKINIETALMIMEARTKDGEELPEHVEQAMRASDVVIAPTYCSITHTKATRLACEAGARVASMPRVPKYSFIKGGLTADYERVKKYVEKMFFALQESNFVEVTSPNKTNVYFSIRRREWHKDTGFILNPGEFGNLPAGEVFIAPIEETINGKIVFDSFDNKKKKVKLMVEDGLVKEVEGSSKLKRIFRSLGKKARQICEFGIGCNYKAKVIGNTIEDEKALGSIHFGLGNNVGFGGRNNVPLHLDGIIEKPTVKVDNRIIIKDGKWKI
ncbi:MAG TPA: aminopeptidase [Candidatus Aenigmarchaeota archaeon]|nr:aminopeptidase [Candidatus Aenigmarchaeota archaeon]